MAGRLVVGVDGSRGSRHALAWAVEEAAVRRSSLDAVAVWQSPYDLPREVYYPVDEQKLAEEAKARLDEAIAGVGGEHAAVEIQPVLLEGDPAEMLCRRAAEADLLVVGSRGRGGFVGLLLGSVSTACAHHCPNPVVIVPEPRRDDRSGLMGSARRIVVGVDGSPGSRRALGWAVDEGAARGAIVEALMVWRGVEAGDDMAPELAAFPSLAEYDRATAASASDRLGRIVSAAGGDPSVAIEPIALEGDPAETLCRYAADADLLVVGSRGRGTFSELLLGSVSAKCAHHSPRPVVIVPTGRAGRGT